MSNIKNSDGNYKDNVTFDEIYALFNFDKNIKYLFLKYGYYEDKRLIVSSGVGTWHNPVRTSKYSEIVEVNIKKI